MGGLAAAFGAAEANGWDYVDVAWNADAYRKNPKTCEALQAPPDRTLLVPVEGVKDGKYVTGEMCCLGDIIDGNFWVEYCLLTE